MPGLRDTGTAVPKRKPARAQRPLVLAPPRDRRSPIFGPVKPAATPGAAAVHRARVRVGRELAKAPGVRARLVPQAPATTPAARRRVVETTRRAAANAGLSASDREAIAATDTQAGRALRQAGRAQAVGARRALTLSGILAVQPGISPTALRRGRLGALSPAQRRSLERVGLSRQEGPAHVGRPHSKLGIGPATIDLTAAGRIIAAQTSLEGASPENSFVKNALGDVGSLGAWPFIGGYQIGDALNSLRQGDTAAAGRKGGALAKALWEGVKTSVPGELAQGNPNAALDSFRRHPVFAALDAAAAAGALGRTAGAFSRAAGSDVAATGLRGALARVGSPVRSPIALTSDAASVRNGAFRSRSYSMDSIRKGVQVAQDRGREPLRDHRGRVVYVTERGRRVPVLKPTAREMERFQHKRANHVASRANAVERLTRAEVAKRDARAARGTVRLPVGSVPGRRAIRGQMARDLTHLVATGVIRSAATFEQDLVRRADRIAAAIQHGDYRHGGELADAVALEKRLRAASKNKKLLAQAPAIVESGLSHAASLNAADRELVRRQVLDAGQGSRAALSEYALAHMDARHFSVEEHKALERAARKKERAALAVVRGLDHGPARDAALDAYHRAVKERLAVSGRHVGQTIAHDRAHAEARLAKERVREARQEVEQVRREVHRRQGRDASQRMADRAAVVQGRMGMREALLRDAKRGKGGADADGQMGYLLGHLKQAEAALKQAEKEHADAKALADKAQLPKTQAALRTADGRLLTDKAIAEHAAAAGRDPASLAYVPHVSGGVGNRAYHQRFMPGTRPRAGDKLRTGVMFERGASAVGEQVVRDTLVHKAVSLSKAEQLDREIHDVALRHPAVAKAARGERLSKHEQRVVSRGGYFTAAEADELAKRLEAEGKGSFVAVRAHSARMSPEDSAALQAAQSPAAMETAHLTMFNDRVVTHGLGADSSRARNVVLMPTHEWNRLVQHAAPAGELEKVAQMMNAPFRMAVLPQTRWLTGNFVEPMFVRLPLSGAGINVPGLAMDYLAARKVLKTMEQSADPALRRAAREVKAQQLGGLFIGNAGASVRRTFEDFPSGKTGAAMYGLHVVRHLPVVKQLLDLAVGLAHGFFGVNSVLERFMQMQGLGRDLRRDAHAFTGSWHKTILLGEEAAKEAAQGLVNTHTQQRYMESQHELLGQYEGFHPLLRRAIQTVMPFLPWSMAAARFVFWTLPVHHTVATAALLKISQNQQAEWEQAHKGIPPDLNLGIVQKDGGVVDAARYTPYGFTAPLVAGNTAGIVSPLLPQLSGVESALKSQDPFGKPLKVKPTTSNPDGSPSGWDKVGIALNSALGASIPWLSMAQRFREGGGTPFGNSNLISPKVKPGTTHMSAARRIFDPFRPTYLRPPTVAGSGGSGAAAPLPKDPVLRARMKAQQAQQAAGTSAADRQLLEARQAAAAFLAAQGSK